MTADLILVGGGLASGLLAYRLRTARPNAHILLVERDASLGGNHTWSFHEGDLDREQHAWIAPFVVAAWDEHEVRFPGLERRMPGSYATIDSLRLDRMVRETLGEGILTGFEARRVEPGRVIATDGRELRAGLVLDGRGDRRGDRAGVAYQKFLGRVIRFDRPHGVQRPVLMDATVEQLDGFRFFYLLPFDERDLLVEDTRYSDGAELDRDAMRAEVDRYAEGLAGGFRALREEAGVLPIVLDGDLASWTADATGTPAAASAPKIGVRGGLFHPTTGYSLPEAVRMADAVVAAWHDGPDRVADRVLERARDTWRGGAFYRLLNRMLFRAAEPSERYRVLRHFYRKSDALVARFYAGRSTRLDRIRVLSGVPPVPVRRAIACLREAPVPSAAPTLPGASIEGGLERGSRSNAGTSAGTRSDSGTGDAPGFADGRDRSGREDDSAAAAAGRTERTG